MNISNDLLIDSNIDLMCDMHGYDVVIICTSDDKQAEYWQRRLEAGRGQILSADCIVLAVSEDWEGGAGNALGTFYAYQKALQLGKRKIGIDIHAALAKDDISVALYHTAGKGTRLAPLPGAENNNKPGVRLPICIDINGRKTPITILECVLKQTSIYSKSRDGRLSVFWGDQVFIPVAKVEYIPQHHADILCKLGPRLTKEEWEEKNMDKYGLIAVNTSNNAAQVEKITHAQAQRLLQSFGELSAVGVSLGSFSISFVLLNAFLFEFADELSERKGKLDADPHLWMPLTLKKDAYIELMEQKGIDIEFAKNHHDRMRNMINNFNERIKTNKKYTDFGLFGAVDVGENALWWDYGQLKYYFRNNMLLTDDTNEAHHLRRFFEIDQFCSSSDENTKGKCIMDSEIANSIHIDNNSCIYSSEIVESGSINKSILSCVRCYNIQADGCILVNVTARSIVAPPGCIIYNVVDDSEEGIILNDGEIKAGVFSQNGKQICMNSLISVDGGKVWKNLVAGNEHSFESIYFLNQNADVTEIENRKSQIHSDRWANIHTPPTSPVLTNKKILNNNELTKKLNEINEDDYDNDHMNNKNSYIPYIILGIGILGSLTYFFKRK